MRYPTLLAVSLAAALLSGAGCNLVSNEAKSSAPGERAPGKPAYAAFERKRVEILQGELAKLLSQTIRIARVDLAQMEASLAELAPSERLSTNDPVLRAWHKSEWKAYGTAVEQLYEVTLSRLKTLREEAIAKAISRAEAIVGKRSPLDDGPTGSTLVDQAVMSFTDSLEAELALEELANQAEHDAVGRVELVHVFSTFTAPEADELLGGRLTLFVGGSEDATAPRVKLVLKSPGEEPPEKEIRVLNAIRYRIFRGHSIVQDMGWQPSPAEPSLTLYENALFISNIEPRLDANTPAFEKLHGMRVLADMQTALSRDGVLLGGIDWRIEFRITVRGDVSWQLSGAPQFTASAEEAAQAFR
ncbi:MAG: hypothetical protein P8N09_02225 [Planctomycetota bacterium]|jgi:hypothetical protein|nr:hypothetical protein [Planctomycetota bacterium]